MTDDQHQPPAAPSVPAGVPDTVTREQVRAALRLLGLPADAISSVYISTDVISLTVLVRSATGRIWARDNGEPLTATAYVDVVDDPRPQRPPAGGTISPRVFVDPEHGTDGCVIPPAAASTRTADGIKVRLSVKDPGRDAFKRLLLNEIVPARAAQADADDDADADDLPTEG
ncbi:hypothetical protein [Kitasatospora sp. NPDC057500]|uniref:hypothetical protein n=1 Tax=Kitasatospora sp. NPDC057500 TaxID=3346151 RepID=UPI0036ACED69